MSAILGLFLSVPNVGDVLLLIGVAAFGCADVMSCTSSYSRSPEGRPLCLACVTSSDRGVRPI
jgi:hypothetical protein